MKKKPKRNEIKNINEQETYGRTIDRSSTGSSEFNIGYEPIKKPRKK